MTASSEVTERDIQLGDLTIRIREAGDRDGAPILYFHGTPGSRLDMKWAEPNLVDHHVRLVCFDRPGYGGSTAAPFGLRSIGQLAGELADELDLTSFATLGMSGGGPFALATAAVLPDRVTAVGVASGAGSFTLVPGAMDRLDETDLKALALIPTDPAAAAAIFGSGFAPMVEMLSSTGEGESHEGFASPLSPRDLEIDADPNIGPFVKASLLEGLRGGVSGGGWDNVAWVGPWDIALDAITCPVFLWYGEEDRMSIPAAAEWLHANLPTSELTLRPGIGHFGLMDFLGESLSALRPPD